MRAAFYAWMIIIACGTVYPFFAEPLPPGPEILAGDFSIFQIVASASLGLKLVWVVGGLVSIGACILWLILSRNRKRRNLAATILGVILFIVGSYAVGLHSAGLIVTWLVLKASNELREVGPVGLVFCPATGSLVLLGSYFLCFQQKRLCPFLSKSGMCEPPGAPVYECSRYARGGVGHYKDCLVYKRFTHPGSAREEEPKSTWRRLS